MSINNETEAKHQKLISLIVKSSSIILKKQLDNEQQ